MKADRFTYDAVFYMPYAILYHKFGNMVISRPENFYTLCSPENQHYQKIIYFFNFFVEKDRNRRSKLDNQKYKLDDIKNE